MAVTLKYKSKVSKSSMACSVCGTSIAENNWYLSVIVKRGRVSKVASIHDNEGVCKEVLEVRLGLKRPTYLSSLRPDYST